MQGHAQCVGSSSSRVRYSQFLAESTMSRLTAALLILVTAQTGKLIPHQYKSLAKPCQPAIAS